MLVHCLFPEVIFLCRLIIQKKCIALAFLSFFSVQISVIKSYVFQIEKHNCKCYFQIIIFKLIYNETCKEICRVIHKLTVWKKIDFIFGLSLRSKNVS